MKFFFNLLEDVLRDRSQSKEVGVCLQNYVHAHWIWNNFTFCEQNYHDFIEIANESISEFTKEVDGKTVPMWTREEIDEIIMGQVWSKNLICFV